MILDQAQTSEIQYSAQIEAACFVTLESVSHEHWRRRDLYTNKQLSLIGSTRLGVKDLYRKWGLQEDPGRHAPR